MRKDQKWSGLITHASPYLLPRGASQEQVNVQCRTPGELQTRRGMLPLYPSGGAMGKPRDVFAISGNQGSRILLLQQNGTLEVANPLLVSGGAIGGVYEPPLSALAGQTETNYLWQYRSEGGATSNLVFVFYGGSAAQDSWRYEVTPSACRPGARTSYSAGNAAIAEVRGVSEEELCRYDN